MREHSPNYEPDVVRLGSYRNRLMRCSELGGPIGGLGDGSINLFTGPLNYQDGSPFLGDGEEGSDVQIWYMKQLLEGMEGASSS